MTTEPFRYKFTGEVILLKYSVAIRNHHTQQTLRLLGKTKKQFLDHEGLHMTVKFACEDVLEWRESGLPDPDFDEDYETPYYEIGHTIRVPSYKLLGRVEMYTEAGVWK